MGVLQRWWARRWGGKAAGTMFEIGLGGRVGRGRGARLEWKPIFTNLNFFVFPPTSPSCFSDR